MEIKQTSSFQNDLKKIVKKHHLGDDFYQRLCQEILAAPLANAILLREESGVKFLKRRLVNPAKGRGKSHGFRLYYTYTIIESVIHLCMLVDVSEKIKEMPTDQYIRLMKDRFNVNP